MIKSSAPSRLAGFIAVACFITRIRSAAAQPTGLERDTSSAQPETAGPEEPSTAMPAPSAPEPPPMAKQPDFSEKEKPPVKITPTGYVEAYYAYNFNRPSNAITNARGFDNRHNTFSLSNAVFGANWEAGPIGGRLLLQIGSTPSRVPAVRDARAGEFLVTTNGLLQLALYCLLLVAVAKPLGGYMARVYQREARVAARILGPIERLVYRVLRVDAEQEMTWKTYALAVMFFNVVGLFVVYLLQRTQGSLPLNPASMGAVTPDSAFNTAVSFASNTNWQGYGGETTMSYPTQMLGLSVQNFVSAATGMAVLVAMIRGFSRKTTSTLVSFWVDLVRTTLYILLPLSIAGALILVSQGVVQTFGAYASGNLLDGKGEQLIALGPAASRSP